MFIGHYAASFALKAKEKKASLVILFLAVQFIDILFFPLVLMGVERFNIIENFTQSTHFQLEYMPYTHSLVGAIFWSLVAYVAIKLWKANDTSSKIRVAVVVGLAVLSHWFLDLIVHTPDLPLLTDSSPKFGFGLWNSAVVTYVLEAVLLAGGLFMYMKSTRGTTAVSKYGMPVFFVLLLLVNVLNIFGPLDPEATHGSIAGLSLFLYLLFPAIAFWIDRNRVSVDAA